MDELQLSCYNGELHLWGVSSYPEEQFTPKERLNKTYNMLFSPNEINYLKFSKLEIEIPAVKNSIIVSDELKLVYGQYDDSGKASIRKFHVDCIILELGTIMNELLRSEKQHGFYFGESFDGLKSVVRFAYSLVARQRFMPFIKGNKSYFQLNLDNNDDFLIFKDICEALPPSVKPRITLKTEDAVYEFLENLVNFMIKELTKDINLEFFNRTKTDNWLSGFFRDGIKVDDEVKAGVSEWAVSRNVCRTHEYNILFKLEEPDPDREQWRLRYAVQSKHDLSLIISFDDIWQNRKKINLPNYKLHLIKELGMAARFSKVIEKSMLKPNPSLMLLSEEEALAFMKFESFMLKDFGFVVHIPKITSAKLSSLRVILSLKKPKTLRVASSSGLSDALFDFDYGVAIGDDTILSREEFYKLSSLKSGLVNVSGKWVELNSDDVKKVISFLDKKKQISISEIISTNASGDVDFEIEAKSFPENLGSCFLGLESPDLETPPPDFCGELRGYQRQGYSWLIVLRKIGFGGILADDMGLGKTIQAISYLLYLKKEQIKEPSLIVAPTSVIGNWEREFLRFAPSLKVHIYHGSMRKKIDFSEQIKGKDVIITSYGTMRNDRDFLAGIAWNVVILDEAQNIKNPYTKQAASAARLTARHRLCLTGTPIENRLSELWSLINFSNKGLLSSWDKFRTNFAEPIELNSDHEKTMRLKKIISPFILRRLKSDKNIISDLPEKNEIKEYCTLTEEQATLYQAIVDESLKKIKEAAQERRMNILSTIIKLKQVCNHPTNFLKDPTTKIAGRSGKLERLCEMVEVFLENNEKCLVFTQFREMGDILKQALEEYFSEQVLFLHGQLNRNERERMITLFQNERAPRIFVLSLKAGGFGINLTAANQVIHFDRWWNPAVENQATDRAYRIGQKKNVFIYKYITSGTIEEKIDEILETKSALSDSLLSKGEAALTELSDGKLREIFSLRRDSFS